MSGSRFVGKAKVSVRHGDAHSCQTCEPGTVITGAPGAADLAHRRTGTEEVKTGKSKPPLWRFSFCGPKRQIRLWLHEQALSGANVGCETSRMSESIPLVWRHLGERMGDSQRYRGRRSNLCGRRSRCSSATFRCAFATQPSTGRRPAPDLLIFGRDRCSDSVDAIVRAAGPFG